MIRLSEEKVKLLYQLMVEATGGTFGIRDENLLNSALEGIFQTFNGKYLYPSKEEKGAMLGYSIISNHAFVDGNKRIGVYIMLTFLEVNGIRIDCSDEELITLGLGLAAGEIGYEGLLDWILDHEA